MVEYPGRSCTAGLTLSDMRVVVAENGAVVVEERPDPLPSAGELLVRVHGAGINSADLLQRAGLYPPPPGAPDTMGMEFAGRVEAVGPATDRFAPGDAVMAVVGGGAQAELALVHERCAIAVPEGTSLVEAGGFPEVFTTAHDALFTQCGLGSGERVLVTGAAGGVGIAGVQLAVEAGASVVASVRSPELRPAIAALGATAIDPGEVLEHGPFDVVLELVGAASFADDFASLALGGRIVVIGVGGGSKVELDLLQLMGRRARLSGSTLRSRPLEEKALAARLVERHVVPLLAAGRIKVPVAAAYPLADAQAAYERFRAGGKLGKLVLDLTA